MNLKKLIPELRKKMETNIECIIDIKRAISEMDEYCFKVIGRNNTGKRKIEQAAEHAFTAELYHRMKVIMFEKKEYYRELQLHFDLGKEAYQKIRPDLVLHHSPDDKKIQRLYIEIKTSFDKEKYKRDIDKIINSVSDHHLKYENALFLVAKVDREKVVEVIFDYLTQKKLQTDKRLSKINLIHVENLQNITTTNFQTILTL